MGFGVFAAALAATAYPPAVALYRDGVLGAFRYFASDAFYYLSIARYSAGRPFFTFDGIHPTSGFHPFWQWLLASAVAFFDLGEEGLILFTAVLGVALVSIGTALFAWVLLRLTRRPWLALIGAVPGAYYWLVPSVDARFFAPWSFANGMESPLSIFLFGILLAGLFGRDWLRSDASLASIVGVSALLSLIVLTRLDDVFIFVPFVFWAAFANGSPSDKESRREALRRVAAMALVPTLAIGAYLTYNALHTGSPIPSSGATKWQPLWALGRNLYALWTTVLPFADPLGRGSVAWSSEAWRVLQMAVPAMAAVAWLLGRPMGRGVAEPTLELRDDRIVGLLAVYVLCKAVYNFSMVGLWHQGQWYYPLSIMVFDLICAVWLARSLDRRSDVDTAHGADTLAAGLQRRWPAIARAGSALAFLGAAVLVLISANAFVDGLQRGPHPPRNFAFWMERAELDRLLDQTCPGCGVLEFDDGIVAFSLEGTATLNGLGLAMDRQAQQALQQGRLLELAWQRGHRVFTSVNYEMPRAAYADPGSLREFLARNRHFEREDLEAWDFEIAFESPTSQVFFVRFEPRRAADSSDAHRPLRWDTLARRSATSRGRHAGGSNG